MKTAKVLFSVTLKHILSAVHLRMNVCNNQLTIILLNNDLPRNTNVWFIYTSNKAPEIPFAVHKIQRCGSSKNRPLKGATVPPGKEIGKRIVPHGGFHRSLLQTAQVFCEVLSAIRLLVLRADIKLYRFLFMKSKFKDKRLDLRLLESRSARNPSKT